MAVTAHGWSEPEDADVPIAVAPSIHKYRKASELNEGEQKKATKDVKEVKEEETTTAPSAREGDFILEVADEEVITTMGPDGYRGTKKVRDLFTKLNGNTESQLSKDDAKSAKDTKKWTVMNMKAAKKMIETAQKARAAEK